MAVTEPASTSAELKSPEFLELRLKELLASTQKSALDPPLTAQDLDSDKLDLIKPIAAADDFYKTSLETAHKAILYDIAVSLASIIFPSHLLMPSHRSSKIQGTMRPLSRSETS
jgi:hypothetical protein